MSTALNPSFLPLAGGTMTGDLIESAHLQFTGNQPTLAAGANAGTSPPAPVIGGGANDNGGSFTFGTGTTPAAGAMVALTFKTAFTNLTANPHVVVTAGNTATQALGLYVTGRSTTGFTLSCTTAPAASQANTVYAVNYIVVG